MEHLIKQKGELKINFEDVTDHLSSSRKLYEDINHVLQQNQVCIYFIHTFKLMNLMFQM